jgi:hypothetical protein
MQRKAYAAPPHAVDVVPTVSPRLGLNMLADNRADGLV